jgi:hypothetical protein
MAQEYYVWDTEAEAQSALDYINGTSWFPIVGNNAATGQPAPNKQRTTKWTDAVQQRYDGKWCFPRVPASRMDAMNVPAEDRQAFLDAFTPSIEEYDETWFVEEESSSSGV